MHPSRKLPLAMALALSTAFGSAATLQVPSQYHTLRDAIKAAAKGDTILIAAGSYFEASDVGTIEWVGKDLVIKGAGPTKTVFSGGTGTRIMALSALTPASRIEGISFMAGMQAAGGAILNTNGSLTFVNCLFEGNQAANGGAILNDGGSPTFVNCTFRQNKADSNGAAIYNQRSNATITHCVFDRGIAGRGGVLYNDTCSPKVTSCVFKNNQTYDGGAIANSSSTATLVDCVFLKNMAFHEGGAIHNNFSSSSIIVNCTFANNSATPNFQSGLGGAICNVTQGGYGNNNVTVVNSIFWGNTSVGDKLAIHGPATVSYSDLQDLTNATPDAKGNFAADPLFVDLTKDNLHLQAKSPCLDGGNNASVAAPSFVPVADGVFGDAEDCRRISSAKVDLGAYEYQSATDLSGKISIRKMGESPDGHGGLTQKVIVTNNTGTLLEGPISLVLSDLKGYTLTNRSGLTKTITPAGQPYIDIPFPLLAPGTSVPITLSFTKSGTAPLSYTIHVVDGIGGR